MNTDPNLPAGADTPDAPFNQEVIKNHPTLTFEELEDVLGDDFEDILAWGRNGEWKITGKIGAFDYHGYNIYQDRLNDAMRKGDDLLLGQLMKEAALEYANHCAEVRLDELGHVFGEVA